MEELLNYQQLRCTVLPVPPPPSIGSRVERNIEDHVITYPQECYVLLISTISFTYPGLYQRMRRTELIMPSSIPGIVSLLSAL